MKKKKAKYIILYFYTIDYQSSRTVYENLTFGCQ